MASSTPTPLYEPHEGVPDVTHHTIDKAISALAKGHGPFSVDTERAMGIRYSDRAYLIQIRREGAGTFLIDPIGIEDHFPALADVMVQDMWILHAADQDLPCLNELGLQPPKLFDTEMAGLLLGFPKVSLQSEIANILNISLAKEHSFSDWSQRPLSRELRTYAALDVELLLPLSHKLTHMLTNAGRLHWLEEECEDIRLRPPKEKDSEPWRKVSRSEKVSERRALGMLAALWQTRDDIARENDVNPSHILPSKALAQLAKSQPRSLQDVTQSPILRSHSRKRYARRYWDAIAPIWNTSTKNLPERKTPNKKLTAGSSHWTHSHVEASQRWDIVRSSVVNRAEELGIRQDILLKPARQKLLAWQGWTQIDDIPHLLADMGARPWQVENTAPAIMDAARKTS